MQKNVAGQKWRVFAFNITTGAAVTGDAANITGKISIDFAAAGAITDTNPTETEDGYYLFDLTQAETNGDDLAIYPESSTSNVQVIGVPGCHVTTPENYQELGIESDGDLTKVNTLDGHTAQTADHTANIAAILVDTGTTLPAEHAALPTAAENRAEMDSNSTQLAAIAADTNELQSDDTPGALAAIDAKIDTIDGIVDNILTDTGATLDGKINTIDSLIDQIVAKLPSKAYLTGTINADGDVQADEMTGDIDATISTEAIEDIAEQTADLLAEESFGELLDEKFILWGD